jgi:hypothetical protein
MSNLDRPAPCEIYLYIQDCKSGEEFFIELKDDDLLCLKTQINKWLESYYDGGLMLDGEIMSKLEGDYYASIKTDYSSPDSVVSWEGGGFYLKPTC